MKLKLLIYIVLATVLGVIFSCSRSRNDRRQGDMDIFLLDLSASLGDNPEEVNRTIDSLLQTTSDSFLYYRCLLLKSKSAFYGGNLDSSMLMLGQVEVFCNKWLEDRRVFPLWADYYNMRGNLYGRKGQVDSMVWAFEKSYHYVQVSGNIRIMPDICLNLADAYVRNGRYDLGAFWYRRCLFVMDSLQLPDPVRFPAYY